MPVDILAVELGRREGINIPQDFRYCALSTFVVVYASRKVGAICVVGSVINSIISLILIQRGILDLLSAQREEATAVTPIKS